MGCKCSLHLKNTYCRDADLWSDTNQHAFALLGQLIIIHMHYSHVSVHYYQLISSPDVGGNHRSSLASFKAFQHTQSLSVQFEEGFSSLFLLISVVSTKWDIYRSKPSTSTCTCNYLDLTKLKNILSFAASLRNIMQRSSSNQQVIDFTCVPV